MPTLEGVVSQLKLSAARARGLNYLTRAVCAAAGWAVAVLLLARLVPIEPVRPLTLAGIPAALLTGAVIWLVRRPSGLTLTSAADQALDLKERLSTAWERRAMGGPLDRSQRQDALTHAARVQLAGAFPLRVRRGEASLAVALGLAWLALLLLPNPMDTVIARRQSDRASQSKAAAVLHQKAAQLASAADKSPANPQVQQILTDTQKKIQSASSPREALEAISPAEDSLRRLTDPSTPARSSDAQNLAAALSGTSAGRSAGQALGRSPAQGAQALRDLSANLNKLTPQQRQELSRALARAAAQSQTPSMRDSLQSASDALARGDQAAAARALDDASRQLDDLQGAQQTDREVASAVDSLESAREELARQADQDAGTPSGSSAGPGASASPGAGASPGHASGGTGGNNGNGNGTGTGSGTGNGSGSGGGTGSQGSGSGSGGAGQASERIYVPGAPVPGQSEDQPTPLGPGQDVPLSPVTQVLPQYEHTALDVLDHSLVPGSEKDLVRDYFSSLGEPEGPQ